MNISNFEVVVKADGRLYMDVIHPAPCGPTEYYQVANYMERAKCYFCKLDAGTYNVPVTSLYSNVLRVHCKNCHAILRTISKEEL